MSILINRRMAAVAGVERGIAQIVKYETQRAWLWGTGRYGRVFRTRPHT